MRILIESLQRASAHVSSAIIPMLLIAAILGVLVFGKPHQEAEKASDSDWTCSMHPQVRLPKPGRCPFCGMTLIPVSKLEEEQDRVTLRAGIETEPVQYRELFKQIRTVGKIDYNESRVKLLTARIAGRADRIYADFTGIKVSKNDHLVDLYSPELLVAQNELILALEATEKEKTSSGTTRSFHESRLAAARTKLRLLGILDEQIAAIEQTRKPTTHLTIYAPIGGVVIEKNVREQQYVEPGDALYRIAELDPIWLFLDIYEYDLGWVRFGQPVDVTVEAYPGEVFHGTVVFIDPFLNDQTRTVKVRVNLPNPDHRLKPAMYASATIHVRLQSDGTPVPTGLEGKFICPMHPEIVTDEAGQCPRCEMNLEKVPRVFPAQKIIAAKASDDDKSEDEKPTHKSPSDDKTSDEKPTEAAARPHVLAIRKSAVLDTGRRHATYRKRKDGAFELVDLKLGPLAEAKDDTGHVASFYPVLEGLKEGDHVVVQGGFMLDSQRQIEGMPSLLYPEGRSAASLHAGHAMPAAKSDSKQPMPTEHKH